MDRKYYMTEREELKKGKIKVELFDSSAAVFAHMADEMFSEIYKNNREGRKTVFICPVGPVGQYPYFVERVNKERLDLKNVWFINMDEYLTEDDQYIDYESPLSFHGFMDRTVYSKISTELVMPPSHRVFPDPKNPGKIKELISELGGVDIAFGGIGINGHLAFNEAEAVTAEVYSKKETRVLHITKETLVSNGIGDLNGALELMPTKAVTIGINEILSARRIRLGVFRPWHRAVIRRAIFDNPSGSFPVTLAQKHPDAVIYVNDVAAERPL